MDYAIWHSEQLLNSSSDFELYCFNLYHGAGYLVEFCRSFSSQSPEKQDIRLERRNMTRQSPPNPPFLSIHYIWTEQAEQKV
jgi:hypothetical protein